MAVDETRFEKNGSYEVRVDEETNTLYLALQGRLTRRGLAAAAEEMVGAASQFDGEFSVVNDISAFRPVPSTDADLIGAVQAELKAQGVEEVVRVATEETSTDVVDAFRRRAPETGYEGRTVPTVGAAERRLGI